MKNKLLSAIFIFFTIFILFPNSAQAEQVFCGMDLSIQPTGSYTVASDWWAYDIGNTPYNIYLDFDGSGLNFVGKLGVDNGFGESGHSEHTYSTPGDKFIRIKSGVGCDDIYKITIPNPTSTSGCTDSNATNYNSSATVDDGSCTYNYVNLNFVVGSSCGGPVAGASVSINRDFGNGTTRTTDSSGFANYGVYGNTSVSYSVSATGYSSASGSVNSGVSGTTVTPTLTNNSGCGGAASGYPDIVLSASPTSVYSGSASTISWTVTNANSCTASGNWSGSKSTTSSSESTGAISSAKSYTLSCSNGTGTTVKTVNVGIIAGSCSTAPTSVPSGAYTIVTYTCNGIFTTPSGVSSVDYLIVGGGGGGGNGTNRGGGGGGGNVVGAQNSAVTAGATYNIVVGTGGAAQSDGAASSFSTFTAAGGSGGGGGETNGRGGTIGGGGGSYDGNTYAVGGVGSVHSGGDGDMNAGGGGGGAGANGGNAGGFNQAGNGGAGKNIAYIDGNTYGGGGGGASYDSSPVSKRGSGGAGGGGSGGGGGTGVAGTANTGGGGGGSSQGGGVGGSGGSGIVKIKYLTPATVNGACGTANNNYADTVTDWPVGDTFCYTGTLPATPTFPSAGNSVSWSCLGSLGGTTATCTATRGSSPYSINVTKTTGGYVKAGDNSIDCGGKCSGSYTQNSVVTLQAYPISSYWKFDGWIGDCSGTGLCVLVVDAAKAVTALFSPRSFNYSEF